jgi:hypothetical protein
MNRLARFWQELLRNWDVYLVIVVGTLTLLLSVLSQINSAAVLPLALTMLGIIAISIRRDRHIDTTMMYSLVELSSDVKSLAKNRAFEQQDEAYNYLIEEVINKYGAREAVLIQYSGTTSMRVVRALLGQGARVTVYIQHEEIASNVGSQFQVNRIRATTDNLRSDLGKLARIIAKPGQLKVYKYRSPGSVSAIKIDNRVLCMGWYIYEKAENLANSSYASDTIEVSGHDVAALVVWRDTEEFNELEKTFSLLEKNYQKHAEKVSL